MLAHSTTIEIGSGPLAEIPENGRIVSLPLFPWQRESFGGKPKISGTDLKSAIQQLLELPELPSVSDTFFELGLNSMAMAELSRKFDIPSSVLRVPTITKLLEQKPAAKRTTPASETVIAVIGMGCRFPGGAARPSEYGICCGKVARVLARRRPDGMSRFRAGPFWIK